MENKRRYLDIGQFVILGFLVFLGCKAERDMPTDPRNDPYVFSQEIAYKDQEGVVSIRWEYLGIEPISRFRLLRLEREGLIPLDWVTNQVTRAVSHRADVWDMENAIDAQVNAGENYAYIIRAENAKGIITEGPAGNVQIHGANIQKIELDVLNAKVNIDWQIMAGSPRKFELYRKIEDQQTEQVFQTNNNGTTHFVDGVKQGNRVYHYWLRNFFDHDVILDSRILRLLPYVRNQNLNVTVPSEAYVALAPGQAFGQPLIMLAATQSSSTLQRLNFLGTSLPPVTLNMPNQSLLNHRSISLAVTPVGRPSIPRLLITSVIPDAKRVQLNAFTILGDRAIESAWDTPIWSIDDPEVSTAIAVAPNGTIVVIAGTTLRYFIPNATGLEFGGEMELALSHSVRHATATDDGL